MPNTIIFAGSVQRQVRINVNCRQGCPATFAKERPLSPTHSGGNNEESQMSRTLFGNTCKNVHCRRRGPATIPTTCLLSLIRSGDNREKHLLSLTRFCDTCANRKLPPLWPGDNCGKLQMSPTRSGDYREKRKLCSTPSWASAKNVKHQSFPTLCGDIY